MRFPHFFTVLVFASFISLVSASTYFVDIQNPACNNNGPGSQGTPWCHLNVAVELMQAGDTAYVHPGTYNIDEGPFTETNIWPYDDPPYPAIIRPSNAGTQANPIRLIALSTASQIIGKGNAPSAQDDANQAFIENGIIYIHDGFDYWYLEGFYVRNKGGIVSKENTGFSIKDSLIFVDPSSRDGVHRGGGRSLWLYDSDDAFVDHVEGWSINFDARRLLGNDDLETRSSILNIQLSDRIFVTNSLFYGGRNVLSHSSKERDCVVEDSQIFWGQEHLGQLCPYNFRYTRNVWYPVGQQAPFINVECDYDEVSGVIENNHFMGIRPHAQTYCPSIPWYQGATDIKFRNNFLFSRTDQWGTCFLVGPEYQNVFDSDFNACSSWNKDSPTQPDGNFWDWYGVDGWWPGIEDWIEQNTDAPYSLSSWQVQNDVPQPVQDPNSLFNFGDPMLVTPYTELGQLENDDYPCVLTFGAGFETAISNCEPPYRMRILDDLHLREGSPLINRGDPAYGSNYPGGRIDIGAFEFDGEQPPLTCNDGTPYGECSQDRPWFCQDGTLIEDCGACGCPQGLNCDDGTGQCLSPTPFPTCDEQGGHICTEDESCPGDQWLPAEDSDRCCAVECEGQGSELDCVLDFGGQCLSDCGGLEDCSPEPEGFCNSGVCCVGACIQPTPEPGEDRPFEGYGSQTPGGSGGTPYVVTSLANSGTGSLRDAISQSNRMITFSVGGTILIDSMLSFKGHHITVDGSTAPSPGITIAPSPSFAGGPLMEIDSDPDDVHDIILQHLRFRDNPDQNQGDNLRIEQGAYNIVIDHCSFRRGGDGALDISGSHDITVQWSILADTVKNQLIAYDGTGDISLHHNLYFDGHERNPQAHTNVFNLDIVNNLVYAWNNYGTRIRLGSTANLVKNYYLADAGSDACDAIVLTDSPGPVYLEGNVIPKGCSIEGTTNDPLPAPPVTEMTPLEAAWAIVNEAGAFPRDADDASYIAMVSSALPEQPTPTPTITPEPYCGDGICQNSESCSTCKPDCGLCPKPYSNYPAGGDDDYPFGPTPTEQGTRPDDVTPTPFEQLTPFLVLEDAELNDALKELEQNGKDTQEIRSLVDQAIRLENRGQDEEAQSLWKRAKDNARELLFKVRSGKASWNWIIASIGLLLLVAGALYFASRKHPPQGPVEGPIFRM
ncbi:hypothetical protein KJ765_06345 [Candidatus Micrarchaeota archaeon]|nr:hypothetical protein [Candidatus Micrarchaeota archaeon]